MSTGCDHITQMPKLQAHCLTDSAFWNAPKAVSNCKKARDAIAMLVSFISLTLDADGDYEGLRRRRQQASPGRKGSGGKRAALWRRTLKMIGEDK